MSVYSHKILGGILLVAGTTVGAGMLALPITTGAGGFFYSACFFVGAFVYMLLTLFLLLEANLYSKMLEANIITMAKERLGLLGLMTAWLSFLLLLYAVAAAYMSGGGSLMGKPIETALGLSTNYGIWIFAIIFATIVFFGTKCVDYINRFFMIGLLGAYIALVVFTTPHVNIVHIKGGQPIYLLAAIPVIVLSFTSHIIVPSLRAYFKSDIKKLKVVLFFGSLVPLILYLVWEFLIMGTLPKIGQYSLQAIGQSAHPVAGLTDALRISLDNRWIAIIVGGFAFFALVTSFLGVVLSLSDFLADGFNIPRTPVGRILLLILTFVPPLIFALAFPGGFVVALSYAGVFVAVLYGILPAAMVWKARYVQNLEAEFRVPGGRATLVFALFGALAIIAFQIAAVFHWLPK